MDIDHLKKIFYSKFGRPDESLKIYFAPGRVNLIGEHTDYNGGYVLPCALQFGTFLLIRKTNDGMVRLVSTNASQSATVPLERITCKNEIQWVNYPLGIFDQFRQMKLPLSGFEMLFSGDIPSGAGLSSSASIEMVTAYALSSMLAQPKLGLLDLIRLSRKAENQFVGVNCGIMDQFAVGLGEKDHALFINCHTLEYKRIPIVLNGFRLIIANTNKPRDLVESKYNERVAECQLAVTYLNQTTAISRLGEISFMQFFKIQDRIPDEVIRKRARHVISENQRVLNAVSSLLKGDLRQFGALMNASHESLRENYEVTGIELDTMVEEAQKQPGVLGARMTGAGFGGCTVNLVREDQVDTFCNRVGEGYKTKTGLTPEFYFAEISNGVKEITNPYGT